MPQIWLKRHLYDGLVKKEVNVEEKVDELVEDFLGLKEDISDLSTKKGNSDEEGKKDGTNKDRRLKGLIMRHREK